MNNDKAFKSRTVNHNNSLCMNLIIFTALAGLSFGSYTVNYFHLAMLVAKLLQSAVAVAVKLLTGSLVPRPPPLLFLWLFSFHVLY